MLHLAPPRTPRAPLRPAAAGARLFAVALLLLVLGGCGAKSRPDAQPPAPEERPATRALPADQPLILVASLGEKPNIVAFNLLNPTDRECPVVDRFFGLILQGKRQPRPFHKGRDWAQIGAFSVPAGGQVVGMIEWGAVPPLVGQKLVFNPEGSGFPPVFAVIERVVVVAPEDETAAGGGTAAP